MAPRFARRPAARWGVREAAPELSLAGAAGGKRLVLTAPTPLEGDGQAGVVAWFRQHGFAEGVRILATKVETANNFRASAPTEAEKRRVILWQKAQERRGAVTGTLDTVTLWPVGRSAWIEFKREGETLSALSAEQEDEILRLHAAGFPVGLAHAIPQEAEELYLAWGVPLRQRVPAWLRKPPHEGRLRWPLRDADLAMAILALREQRRARER